MEFHMRIVLIRQIKSDKIVFKIISTTNDHYCALQNTKSKKWVVFGKEINRGGCCLPVSKTIMVLQKIQVISNMGEN